MMKNYHFSKEVVKAHDIFFAQHYDYNGKRSGHYFYCIYSQEEDVTNDLFRDVVGLLITTKENKGYQAKIKINGKNAYVMCDTLYRFMSDNDKVHNKYIKVPYKTRRNVMRGLKRFSNENFRQLRKGV